MLIELFVTLLLGQLPSAAATLLPPMRPVLVSLQNGAPVMLEGSRSSSDQPHAAVQVRNVSDRSITAITFALTVGVTPGDLQRPAIRKTLTVPVVLGPNQPTTIDLRAFGGTATLTRLVAATTSTAELGILDVSFADDEVWAAPEGASWLSRPDVPVTLRCADASGATYGRTETAVDSLAGVRICTERGVLKPGYPVEKSR